MGQFHALQLGVVAENMLAVYCCDRLEGPVMADIQAEIVAYEQMRADLESKHLGKWVLVHGLELVGVYDTFEAAAQDAVKRFGRESCLIRQVGAPPITLPASVLYNLG